MLRSHLQVRITESLFVNTPSSNKGINTSLLEFASRNTSLKQHIHLSIRPALWFRDSEICPYRTQHTSSSPEETGFGSPVPGVGVEHVRGEDVGDDIGDVVAVAGEYDGLVAEACGGTFGDEGIAG
jgi:hypothetical protein